MSSGKTSSSSAAARRASTAPARSLERSARRSRRARAGMPHRVQTTPQIDLKTSARALRAPTSVQARQRRTESERGFIDENKQALGSRRTRDRNRGPIVGFVGEMKGQSTTSTGVRVPFLHGFPTGQIASQSELASLERANDWLNSPPLTASALRGKVVLIDFWTYTCINWRRTPLELDPIRGTTRGSVIHV